MIGNGQVSIWHSAVAQVQEYFDLVLADPVGEQDLSDVPAELVFVFGGDGSILRAALRMAVSQRPIVGINLGRLGFLADLSPAAFSAALPQLAQGQYRVVEHLMLQTEVWRSAACLASRLGLNETAVLAGEPFTMLDIDLYVDAELVTTYSCDGLIVSTPVGSTAHSLSAGGPILRKELQAFVISPISPHTLTMRPVVDAADRTYEMVVRHPNAGTAVVVDGQLLHRIAADDRIRIQRAKPRFQLVEVVGRSYYRTLREKLGWGGRMRRLDEHGAS
jgi:NAD+ kinase